MIRYVLGFVFTPDSERMLFTQKAHGPGDMAGRLNGIGGHVEPYDETSHRAMIREGQEETGLSPDWLPFCTMRCGSEWVCDCFVATADALDLDRLDGERNDAREILRLIPWERALRTERTMLNLKWLIPMAVERTGVTAEVYYPAGQRGDK